MKVTLKPLGGLVASDDIPITNKRFVIGRAPDCDVRIPLSVVSRHHCVILIEDGMVRVCDLNSRHGTFVNEDRVEDSRELYDGDVLHLTVASFEVRIQQATESSEPADLSSSEPSLFARLYERTATWLASFLAVTSYTPPRQAT